MKTDLATAASGRRSGRRGASEAGPWRPEEGLCYRLKHAYHAWTRHFDAALRPLGLTHVQFLALYAI